MKRCGLGISLFLLLAAACNTDGTLPVVYSDASVPPDQSTPLDLTLVAPDLAMAQPARCGDTSGLQAAAPWPMAGQCPGRQGRSLLPGPSRSKLRWQVSVWQEGGTIAGSPVVDADEVVYFATRSGLVHAVDGRSGVEKWSTPLSRSPVVSSRGVVLVATNQFNVQGTVRALDLATGRMRWQSGTFGRVVSALVPGAAGALHIADADGVLHALSDSDGKERWHRQVSALGEQPPTGPALLDKGVVLGTSDRTAPDHLVALGSDGAPRWNGSVSDVLRDPVVDGPMVYAVTGDALQAFDSAGAKRWSRPAVGASSFQPAIGADGTVYFATERSLLALDATTGGSRWSFDAGAAVTTPPVIDGNGVVFVGAADHNVKAIDGSTGALQWAFPAGAAITGEMALGNGTLYVGSDDGYVYCVGP